VANLVVGGGGSDEAGPCLRFNALVGLEVMVVPTVILLRLAEPVNQYRSS
jgi:hypothetical protein